MKYFIEVLFVFALAVIAVIVIYETDDQAEQQTACPVDLYDGEAKYYHLDPGERCGDWYNNSVAPITVYWVKGSDTFIIEQTEIKHD